VPPMRGRVFNRDDGPGSASVVLLSEGFWQRRFGGDPSIVGRSITLEGGNSESGPVDVVGIVHAEHAFPADADVWLNMTWPMQIQSRQARWMSAVSRLAPGTDLVAAQSDMVGVAARIERASPDTNRGWTVTMASLQDELVGDTRTALLVLLGATGLILLIACANVANLLLSRSEIRGREMAVRVALGAGRGRLVRQLVTESLLLAAVGAALGLALAHLGVRALLDLAPVAVPRSESIDLDGTVLGVVAVTCVLTGVLFGLAPILRLLRTEVHDTIREGARTISGRHRRRVQSVFVVAQFGMAVMLVVGAGLLLRSFDNVRAVDPGFAAGGVLTVELDVPVSAAPTNGEVTDFYEQLERRVAELPGVIAVGDATTLPLGEQLDYNWQVPFVDRDVAMELDPRAYMRSVSPGFFEAMRVPVVAGRSFTEMDRVGQPGVVMVNEAFVRQFFPGDDPLGERVGDLRSCFGPLGCVHIYGDRSIVESEIVGVVHDIKYDGIRADAGPAIYFSGLQSSVKRRTIAVRTSGAVAPLLDGIRSQLAALNPSLALTNIQTMDDVLATAQSRDRFSALLLTLFGGVALLLASVGVYGVLSQAVAQRRTEVGIRMALGADRGTVRGMVLADGLKLVGVGLVLGTVAALALSGLLSSQLFGVDPRDPLVYASAVLTLLAVGALASLMPAWRATRLDPAIAMRAD